MAQCLTLRSPVTMAHFQIASSAAGLLLIVASVAFFLTERNPHAAPFPADDCEHENITLVLRSPKGHNEYHPQNKSTEFAHYNHFHNITEATPLLIVVRRDNDMETLFIMRITLYIDDQKRPYASMYLR